MRTMQVPLNAFTKHYILKREIQQHKHKHNIENNKRTKTIAKCKEQKRENDI